MGSGVQNGGGSLGRSAEDGMTLVEVVAAVALLGTLSLAAAFLAGTAARLSAEERLRAGALSAVEFTASRLRADLSKGVSVPGYRAFRESDGPGSLFVTVRRTAPPAWAGEMPLNLMYWQVSASWSYAGTPGFWGGAGGNVSFNLVLSPGLERFQKLQYPGKSRGEDR